LSRSVEIFNRPAARSQPKPSSKSSSPRNKQIIHTPVVRTARRNGGRPTRARLTGFPTENQIIFSSQVCCPYLALGYIG
jgi:hypothetical protein